VRVTQVFIGGLLGASFVAPWASFPWLVLPALAIAWAWRGPSGRRHIPGTGPATACLSALTICTLLAGVSSRGLRVSHEEFSTKDFPVNCLLVEIPLHDAWAIDLRGHPSPTLDNLGAAFRHLSPFQATPAGTGLSMLRRMVGFAFGWEDPEWSKEEESLVHDLTEATDLHSTTEPGTLIGIWRVLYTLPREGVVETVNGTAHVAVAASIGAGPESSRLFLSFRVREVNWTTRFYMGLIDPFRRFFVYPPLLRQFAHTWERGDWDSPQETSAGEKR